MRLLALDPGRTVTKEFKGNQWSQSDVGERFWSKVLKTETCWIWLAATGPHGYGYFFAEGKQRRAHRVAFWLTHGRWPTSSLDHLCRTKNCVRPDHLEEVTNQENIRRGPGSKTHCKKGHLRTPENTILHASGSRSCRVCHNERVLTKYHEGRGQSEASRS